jgi:hypothetical protein
MATNKITGLGAPTDDADAATKEYVDTAVGSGGISATSDEIGITNNTSATTGYVTWVEANSGYEPAKVTSTKLTFNASTGVLTSTGFAGSGAALTSIPNSALTNSTISGISLGSNLATLTFGTGLTAGGSSYNGSTGVTITAVAGSTSVAGILQLTDSTSSTSTSTAATPASVKTAYDLANAALPKSGGTMLGAIAMGTSKITGLGDPTNAQDAATKAYVDAAASGIDWKTSVRVATTTSGTLSTAYANGQAVDGVTLVTGDRILIKDQSTGSQNGIYTVNASGAPTRAIDADANAEVTSGFAVFVEEGTANADSGWVLTTNAPITVGTTSLTFVQFTGLGQVTAGVGLTKTGNTLDIDTVPVANGGTGQTSYTNGQLLIGNSTGNTLTKTTLTAGTNVTITNGTGSITISATDTDTNYYPTAVTMTGGTTAGPTVGLTMNTGTVTSAAIPSASASASGIVTTGAQTFAGTKTFSSTISGSISGNAATATTATDATNSTKLKVASDPGSGTFRVLFSATGDGTTNQTVYNAVGLYYNALDNTFGVSGPISAAGAIQGSSSGSFSGNLSTASSLTRSILAGGGSTTATFDNSGNLVRTTSSARYKQDIADADYAYADVLALEPKTFRLKDEVLADEDARTYGGFIAEEVDQLDSLKVFVNYLTQEDGNKIPDGINYGEMVAALVSAIKHQDSVIQALTARIETLEAK